MLRWARRQVKASAPTGRNRLCGQTVARCGAVVSVPDRVRGAYPTDGSAMSISLQRLLPLFQRELGRDEPMVLATLARTAGPTYTKPGAQLLIARDGEYAGLLSGGCLEGDLGERAQRVFNTGRSELARYDMRGPEDLLFGMGSGCEGAMDILLQRLDSSVDWQPLKRQAEAWTARRPLRLLLVVRPAAGPDAPPQLTCHAGAGLFLEDNVPFGEIDAHSTELLRQLAHGLPATGDSHLLGPSGHGASVLLLEQPAPPHLLLLGAGPDAQPVAHLAVFLGWSVTVIDHRSHYARAERFPGVETVLDEGAAALTALLTHSAPHAYRAAVVMSHHLRSDLAYLRALAATVIPYVGLLGPATRRDRLLGEMSESEVRQLQPRLRAPVGLDLGAASPEAIALAIVAEIHASLSGAGMGPLSALRPCGSRAVTAA